MQIGLNLGATLETQPRIETSSPKDATDKPVILSSGKRKHLLTDQQSVAQSLLRNLHKVPPNLEESIEYGAKRKIYQDGTDNKLIPLYASGTKLFHLGPSMALYFEFLRLSITLFCLLLLETGIFSIVTNFTANGDFTSPSNSQLSSSFQVATFDFLTRSSWINKLSNRDLVNAQAWVNFGAVVLTIIIIYFYRTKQRKMVLAADEAEINPSNYTIRLRKVPVDASDEEIVEWLYKLLPNQSMEVTDLIRTHKIGRIVELLRLRKQFDIKKLSSKSWNQKAKLNQQKRIIDAELKHWVQKDIEYTDYVFVSLQKSKHCKLILQSYKQRLLQKTIGRCLRRPMCCYPSAQFLKGKYIAIDRAPEPTDVVWENLGYSRMKWKRRLLTDLLTISLIVISFALLFALKLAQSYADKSVNNGSVQLVISILNVLVVTIINWLLTIGIRKLQSLEKKATYTKFFLQNARMITVFLFINSTFMIVLANIAASIARGTDIITDLVNYRNTGLIWDLFFLFIIKSFTPVALSAVNPGYWILRLKRWKIQREFKRNTPPQLTQACCNSIFENPPFDLAYSYATVVSNSWFAGFFLPLFPLGFFILILSYFALFWTKKYELLRLSNFPRYKLSSKLNTQMTSLLEYTCLCFSSGCLFWGYFLNNGDIKTIAESIAYFFSFVTAVIYILLPRDILNRIVFKVEDFSVADPDYSVAQLNFLTVIISFSFSAHRSIIFTTQNYQIENPITREEALTNDSRFVYENNPKFKRYFDQLLNNHLFKFGTKILQQPKSKPGWNQRSPKKRVTLMLMNEIDMYSAAKVGIEEMGSQFAENLNSQTSVVCNNTPFIVKRIKKGFQESQFAVALEDFSSHEKDQMNASSNPLPKNHLITKVIAKEIVKNVIEQTDRKSLEKILMQKKPSSYSNAQDLTASKSLFNGLQKTIDHLAEMGVIKETTLKNEQSEHFDLRNGNQLDENPKIIIERSNQGNSWRELEDIVNLETDKPIFEKHKDAHSDQRIETQDANNNKPIQTDVELMNTLGPNQTKLQEEVSLKRLGLRKVGLTQKQLSFFVNFDKLLENLIDHPNFHEIFSDDNMRAFVKKQIEKTKELDAKKIIANPDDEFSDLFDSEFLAIIARDETPHSMVWSHENEKMFRKHHLDYVGEVAEEAEEDQIKIAYQHNANKIITKETINGQLAQLVMGTNVEEF